MKNQQCPFKENHKPHNWYAPRSSIFEGLEFKRCMGIPVVEAATESFIDPVVTSLLMEADRNARAYGWEIGRGNLDVTGEVLLSDNNPFIDPDWRSKIK